MGAQGRLTLLGCAMCTGACGGWHTTAQPPKRQGQGPQNHAQSCAAAPTAVVTAAVTAAEVTAAAARGRAPGAAVPAHAAGAPAGLVRSGHAQRRLRASPPPPAASLAAAARCFRPARGAGSTRLGGSWP